MIIQDKETTIEQIGTLTDESQFKMRNSQKAFQILSSLYSDKPLAIVRELGCNAMDSHIASGQPNLPFHIHIPNTLEPWLTIQDFGTGISHEDIYNIYSVYFASTKTNTNSQVGMLGLGSKSPFCYTDNFTITSIHENVKRIYSAYFNQQGMPTISLASQENTNDKNGVAIQIPIKQTDIGNFTQSIFRAFRFFDTKPTISGGAIDWTDSANFEGTFWKSYSNLNTSYAVMGGVTYPIDVYKLDGENYDIARKAGLVIKFDIGELDVTPSREALMYHDWVVKALNNKIDKVKNDFVTKVENQIQNSSNLLDAMKALYLLNNQWSFLNSKLINTKVKWKQIDITEPRKSIHAFAPNLKCYGKKVWGRAKYTISGYADLHSSAIWYVDDLKKGTLKRVLQEVRNNSNSELSINVVDQSEMDSLVKAGFPASIFQKTSTLAPVAKSQNKTGTIRQGKPTGVIVTYLLGCAYKQKWDSKDFDLSSNTHPKYYVEKGEAFNDFDGGSFKDDKGKHIVKVRDKGTFQAALNYFGLHENDVVMVSKKNVTALAATGSKSFKELVDKEKVVIDYDKLQQARLIDSSVIERLAKNKSLSKLSPDNDLKKFVVETKSLLNDVKKVDSISAWIRTENKQKALTFPNSMVELFYHSLQGWRVNDDLVLRAALEQEKKSN